MRNRYPVHSDRESLGIPNGIRADREGLPMGKKHPRAGILLLCAVLAVVAAVPAVFAAGSQEATVASSAQAETIVLTDNIGRRVELPHPVSRAVAANRYNSELIRASGAIDYMIGADLNTIQDREYWKHYDPDSVIGKSQRELNYEKIIELDPQVVILPHNGAVQEAEEKLAPFGIKVFVISGYDTGDFENQITNIGKMFATVEEAQHFLDTFTEPLDYIREQLDGVPKKTIYFETTRELGTTFPGGYYYTMIEYAGGQNIFSNPPANLTESAIDPEAVITMNPEYIVKNITPDTARTGTGVYAPPSLEQREEEIQKIKSRPGWDEIDAVKNDNVYVMSQFGHGGASKIVGSLYVAKWMYPERLPDLDPDEYFRAWLEDFQGFKDLDGHFYPKP